MTPLGKERENNASVQHVSETIVNLLFPHTRLNLKFLILFLT